MDIYIANLRKGVSAERLRHLFGHLGDVSSVRIVFSPDRKNDKDFAIISLSPAVAGQNQEKKSDSDFQVAMAI